MNGFNFMGSKLLATLPFIFTFHTKGENFVKERMHSHGSKAFLFRPHFGMVFILESKKDITNVFAIYKNSKNTWGQLFKASLA